MNSYRAISNEWSLAAIGCSDRVRARQYPPAVNYSDISARRGAARRDATLHAYEVFPFP